MSKQTGLSIIKFFAIAFALTFAFSKLPAIPFYSVDIKDILGGFFDDTYSLPSKAWLNLTP